MNQMPNLEQVEPLAFGSLTSLQRMELKDNPRLYYIDPQAFSRTIDGKLKNTPKEVVLEPLKAQGNTHVDPTSFRFRWPITTSLSSRNRCFINGKSRLLTCLGTLGSVIAIWNGSTDYLMSSVISNH